MAEDTAQIVGRKDLSKQSSLFAGQSRPAEERGDKSLHRMCGHPNSVLGKDISPLPQSMAEFFIVH